MSPSEDQRRVAEMIIVARSCVALTGAGISTPSGIPDFRSPGGLWSQVNPMEVAHIDVFRRDPDRFWSFYRQRLDIPDTHQPSEAHLALAELQRLGQLGTIITQNIDGLLQKAGCEDVIEVHGSVRELVCPTCGQRVSRETGLAELGPDAAIPRCSVCSDVLKPDVVLFGEMLPDAAIRRAYALAYGCDLMLCAGSSLEVYPVAELPECARSTGAKLVVITRESAYDAAADVHLAGDIAVELPGVVAAVRERLAVP